jgi:protein TonB
MQPSRIPTRIIMTPGEPEAAPVSFPGVPGGTGAPGIHDGIPGSLLANLAPEISVDRVAPPTRIKVSDGVTAGLLVYKVQPSYPPLARQARISGEVVLQAVIGKDGAIRNLRTISGHPMLIPSAIEAVRQWRYRPYLLNGDSVEVDTQIHINFTLAGS